MSPTGSPTRLAQPDWRRGCVWVPHYIHSDIIYTTEKNQQGKDEIGKGNFYFRQGKGKMCSVNG